MGPKDAEVAWTSSGGGREDVEGGHTQCVAGRWAWWKAGEGGHGDQRAERDADVA